MSRIRTNTLAVGSSFFVTALMGFLQVKILTTAMPRASVGVWSALVAVGALLAAASELGLPLVLVRYGAKYDAEGRAARLGRLRAYTYGVYFAAVAFMVALLLVIGPWLARALGGGEINRGLVILGYLAIASGSLRAFNNACFRGVRSMGAIAYLEIAFALIVTVGYYFLGDRITPTLALSVFLGASLLMGGVGFMVLGRILARVPGKEDPRVALPPLFPEVRDYWMGAAGGGLLLIAIEQLDKPILTRFVSYQELAVFYVAARLSLFARRLLYEPFRVMNPEVTHKWEGPRRGELGRDMELFIKLELGLGLLLTAFLAVFARPLLLLVSTRSFLSGAPIIWTFTAMIPLLCLHQPLSMFLRAVGFVWPAVAADALWLAVYLALGPFFLRSHGLPGFVLGQVLASVVVLCFVLFVFHRRRLPRPSLGFFLRRLAISAVVWGSAVLLGRSLADRPWWVLGGLGVGLALLANALVVWGRFLSPEEETRTVELLAGRGSAGRVARFLFTWPRAGFLARGRTSS